MQMNDNQIMCIAAAASAVQLNVGRGYEKRGRGCRKTRLGGKNVGRVTQNEGGGAENDRFGAKIGARGCLLI